MKYYIFESNVPQFYKFSTILTILSFITIRKVCVIYEKIIVFKLLVENIMCLGEGYKGKLSNEVKLP